MKKDEQKQKRNIAAIIPIIYIPFIKFIVFIAISFLYDKISFIVDNFKGFIVSSIFLLLIQ